MTSLRAAALALALTVAAGCKPRGEPLPRLGAVPAFSMTNQAGRPVTDRDLRGRVWVANFMFTSCAGVCPALTSRVAELSRWLDAHQPPERVRLVSFTVDPDRDKPEVLARYAERFHADPARWSFLTGELTAVENAARAGFKLGVSRERPAPGEPPGDGPDGINILHAAKLVLVDADGRIRGYYDADPEGLARIQADISRLVDDGGR